MSAKPTKANTEEIATGHGLARRAESPWILTHTGKMFHLFEATPEEICIEDIAHALAHLCRFGGHTRRFYSVAEHCVMMSRVLPTLECLLHDAAEAYVGDMVQPLKRQVELYRDVEADVAVAVARKFNLPVRVEPLIKTLDLRMLVTERNQLLGPRQDWEVDLAGYEPLPFVLECLPPPLAKQQFLQRYQELTDEALKR